METETKAAPETGVGVRAALSEFLNAFEHFKDANDRRLAEIETKQAADVVSEEKVARINHALDEQKAAIDRLALASARPMLSASVEDGERAALGRFMRTGQTSGLEGKNLRGNDQAEGGYLLPDGVESGVDSRLAVVSPIRSIASVVKVGVSTYAKPISQGETTAHWTSESGARNPTVEPTFELMQIPVWDLYALPAATQALLDDAEIDLEAWLAAEIETTFAAKEGEAFVAGSGGSKPKGFSDYTTKAEGTAVWGELAHVATGASGDFSADPIDDLLTLIYTPSAAFRANGTFVMNKKTLAEVRKIKDPDGAYVWRPSIEPGGRSSLFGFPVVEAEEMPDTDANANAIAFGDFRRGYLIVDRRGVSILRDPFSAKPYVMFYVTKRVGGAVQDFDAIKFLKFGTA